MTEPTHRMPPHQEALFAPLRRDDLPSFLVALPDMVILAATPACTALGIEAGSPAPLGVKIVAKRVGMSLRPAPRLERVRLPYSFVPKPFACIAVQAPAGHLVVFADPLALATGGTITKALPGLTRLPTVTQTQTMHARTSAREAGRSVRFTWAADEAGRLQRFSPHAAEVLGTTPDQWLGRDFDELTVDGLLMDGAPMRALLRSGGSFFGLTLLTGTHPPRRIEFGGVPLFDAARRRLGTRGFGMLWGDEDDTRRAAPAAEPNMAEDDDATQGFNVVPLRSGALSPRERSAFHEIARTLAEAIEEWPKPAALAPPQVTRMDADRRSEFDIEDADLEDVDVEDVDLEDVALDDVDLVAVGLETEPHRAAAPSEASAPGSEAAEPEPEREQAPAAIPLPSAPPPRISPESAEPQQVAPAVSPAANPPAPADAREGEEQLLDRLPIGIVVQQGGATVRANKTLLGWLGIKDTAAFIAAGGLAPRLVRDGGTGGLDLESLDGDRLPVEVRLVSSPWNGRPALVHVIRSIEDAIAPAQPAPEAGEPAEAPGDPLSAPTSAAAKAETTALLRAERAAARRQALDFVPFPVLLLDRHGMVEAANVAASDVAGFATEDVEDEPFTLLLAQESHVPAVAMLDRATASPDIGLQQGHLMLRHRAGTRIPVEAALAPTGEAGTRFCLVMRPVSDTDTAPLPLAVDLSGLAMSEGHAARLDGLARRISHDVRDPLTAVLAFVDSVKLGIFGPVGNARYLRQAESAAAAGEVLMTVLNDLDGLTVLPSPSAELILLAPIVEEALAHAAAAAQRRRLLLRSSLDEHMAARCDAPALARILRMILDEALAATPAEGQVIVTLAADAADASVALIQVRDGGPALAEDEIAQALDPTRQAPTSDRFTRAGRPFRIAHLAMLMRAQGGSLGFARGVDMGMQVQLRLPR